MYGQIIKKTEPFHLFGNGVLSYGVVRYRGPGICSLNWITLKFDMCISVDTYATVAAIICFSLGWYDVKWNFDYSFSTQRIRCGWSEMVYSLYLKKKRRIRYFCQAFEYMSFWRDLSIIWFKPPRRKNAVIKKNSNFVGVNFALPGGIWP